MLLFLYTLIVSTQIYKILNFLKIDPDWNCCTKLKVFLEDLGISRTNYEMFDGTVILPL